MEAGAFPTSVKLKLLVETAHCACFALVQVRVTGISAVGTLAMEKVILPLLVSMLPQSLTFTLTCALCPPTSEPKLGVTVIQVWSGVKR